MTAPRPAAGSAMGCALPVDDTLTAEGWAWRCNTDSDRLREVVEAFEEMGFEVRLQPLDLAGLSETCGGCRETLSRLSAVYVRRPVNPPS